MTEEKLISLVEKIDLKTSSGLLKWEKTASENEFQTTLANFVIRIAGVPGQSDFDYYITLVDSKGTLLESVSDSELTQMLRRQEIIPADFKPFQAMERIFKNAKRQALGVEKAIDDILSELDNSLPVPPPPKE